MKTLRKCFSILTALALCLTMLPTAVWAADPAEADGGDGPSDVDTIWYNKDQNEFTISTAEELAGLAAIVNGTADGITPDSFSGKTITLTSDIDLAGSADNPWTPIGNGYSYFTSTFDGQGHTISGLYISVGGVVGYNYTASNASKTAPSPTATTPDWSTEAAWLAAW